MRNVLVLIITFFMSCVCLAQKEVILSPELKISRLNDEVWVVTHNFPWESNSLIVKASDKEVVLIDTPYTNEATELVLEFISKEINPKEITAVLTGFHVDNLSYIDMSMSTAFYTQVLVRSLS